VPQGRQHPRDPTMSSAWSIYAFFTKPPSDEHTHAVRRHPITGRQVPRRRWPAYQKTRACSSRAMGEPFVTFAFSYVHTIFCCFSVFVPFDTSLTVSRWLHNLQTKRRPEAGIYPAGSRKVQAGKPAPLPGGQRESRPVPVARGQGDKAAELLRQLLS